MEETKGPGSNIDRGGCVSDDEIITLLKNARRIGLSNSLNWNYVFSLPLFCSWLGQNLTDERSSRNALANRLKGVGPAVRTAIDARIRAGESAQTFVTRIKKDAEEWEQKTSMEGVSGQEQRRKVIRARLERCRKSDGTTSFNLFLNSERGNKDFVREILEEARKNGKNLEGACDSVAEELGAPTSHSLQTFAQGLRTPKIPDSLDAFIESLKKEK